MRGSKKIVLAIAYLFSAFSVAPVLAMLTPAQQNALNDRFLCEVRNGDAEQVKLLVEQKAQVNCYERYTGCTALHIVALNRRASNEAVACEIAKMLIEAQADVNAKSVDRVLQETPLVMAARADEEAVDKTRMVRLLLRACAEVDGKNLGGCTALYRALEHGSVSVISDLLKAGARPEAANVVGIGGSDWSCWNIAWVESLYWRRRGMFEMLIWAGLRPDVPSFGGYNFWKQWGRDTETNRRIRWAAHERCEALLTGYLIKKKLGGSENLMRLIGMFIKKDEVGWWTIMRWNDLCSRDILRAG